MCFTIVIRKVDWWVCRQGLHEMAASLCLHILRRLDNSHVDNQVAKAYGQLSYLLVSRGMLAMAIVISPDHMKQLPCVLRQSKWCSWEGAA